MLIEILKSRQPRSGNTIDVSSPVSVLADTYDVLVSCHKERNIMQSED